MRILNRLILFGAIMLLSITSFAQNKRVRGNYAGPAYAGLAVVIDTLGYTVVDSSATPAIQTDSVFQGAMLQYDTTNGWESVDRAAVLGYKEYVALLTQAGTDAPVATVLYNDLGGTVVWAYGGNGEYSATLTGAFVLNKTSWHTGGIAGSGTPYGVEIGFVRVSANALQLNVNGILIDFVGEEVTNEGDGLLSGTPVYIRVYN